MKPLDPKLRDRIVRAVSARRGRMLDELVRYVAIPTGWNCTQGLDSLRGLLVDRLRALGATTESIPGDRRPDWLLQSEGSGGGLASFNVVPPSTALCSRPVAARTRILISGHLDTVFDPSGSFRAANVSADGMTAVGPGVADMKGGLIAATTALEVLDEIGERCSWSVILNSDEETGSFASAAALARAAGGHDIGLAVEPALPGNGLAIERAGSGQFMVEAFGRAAHAGRDFAKGVSAVYALARVITRLESLSDVPRRVTVNVGPLRGGSATNIVPDHAVAFGNVRFPDRADAEALGRALDALATAESAVPRVSIHQIFNRPAKPLIPETQRLADLAKQTAEELGQTLTFASTGGVCDGNNLQAAGLPTIDSLGVRGGGLHTHDEWIELGSLVDRAALLGCLMTRL